MKFSKETIAVLKNFATINSGIVLTPGNFVMTRSIIGTTYADTIIQDEIDNELAIYDLSGFLSVLSLVGDDAEVTLQDDGQIAIKSNRSAVYWAGADKSTIVVPKAKASFPVANVITELKAEDLQQLKRVASGLNLDTITISNKSGEIVMQAYNKTEDPELVKPKYALTLGEYDGTENFNFVINRDNLKMVPADYKLMLWGKNLADGKKQTAAKFESDNYTYITAMEIDSTFDFQ